MDITLPHPSLYFPDQSICAFKNRRKFKKWPEACCKHLLELKEVDTNVHTEIDMSSTGQSVNDFTLHDKPLKKMKTIAKNVCH